MKGKLLLGAAGLAATTLSAVAQAPASQAGDGQAQSPQKYRVTAIRPAVVPGAAFVYGLSNSGYVTGLASDALGLEAFLFHNGRAVDFYGIGSAVNSAGLTAANRNLLGGSSGGLAAAHAFLWQNGRHWRLATIPGGKGNFATAINDRGVVAGYVFDKRGIKRACLWEKGRIIDLSGRQPGASSRALAVNDRNQAIVAYYLHTAEHGVHQVQETASIWAHGQYVPLTGLSTRYTYNAAEVVSGLVQDRILLNEQGEALAQFTPWHNGTPGQTLVWLWRDGRLTQVKGLDEAFGFNDCDQIVGDGAWPGQYEKRAFLWQNGRITDISSDLPLRSGWQLLEGDAINDSGQIAGKGLLHGKDASFFLAPAKPALATARRPQCVWREAPVEPRRSRRENFVRARNLDVPAQAQVFSEVFRQARRKQLLEASSTS